MGMNHLKASAELINEKAKFKCTVDGRDPIIVDYVPPLGDGEGYTSLELLLLSLATCFGSTVKFMLAEQMKKRIDGLRIQAAGVRREEHPTSFETIRLELIFKTPELKPEELERVMQMAKDIYCPVWAMLKTAVPIETLYRIEK